VTLAIAASSTPVHLRRRSRPARRRGGRQQTLWTVIFLAPAIVALVVLRLVPTGRALWGSLYTAFPGGIIPAAYSGLANYRQLFGDPAFIHTIVRTLVFNVIINPLQIFIALLTAVLMTQKIKLQGVWRTFVFVPVTIPIVGSCIAWGAALSPNGPVNAIISALGGNPQPFFTSASQALGGIIAVASWIGIGYWMLFLIGGLHAIPTELYEAARLDRASPVRTFLSLTIPLLKRPLLFVLVADTVANFVLFVPVQLLTNGGPQSSTTLLMFDAYQTTYSYGSRNAGAAEIVILTLIMLVFVVLQFRLLRDEAADR